MCDNCLWKKYKKYRSEQYTLLSLVKLKLNMARFELIDEAWEIENL